MKKVRTPEPAGFPEFWEAWLPHARNTDGRGEAREAFRKHILNGAEPQDIVDGAKWFLRSMKEREREFIPLASTWLNREAYIDLCHKERAYQERMAGVEASKPAQTKQELQPARARPKTAFLAAYEQKQLLDGINTSTEH